MRKLFPACAALVLLLVAGIANTSAQEWTWSDPYVVSVKVTAIGVDPVTDTVFGLNETGDVVTLALSTTVVGTAAVFGAIPPVRDLVLDQHGVLYAIGDSALATWTESGGYSAVIPQPKAPDGIVGLYKHITLGKAGKLYVLFEAQDGSQHLLVGNPPITTEGVTVKINPTTLNITSKGNWVSSSIALPPEYNASDIDPDSVRIVRIQATGSDGSPIDQITEIYRDIDSVYCVASGKLNVKFVRYDKQDPTNPLSLNGLFTALFPPTSAQGTYNVTMTVEAQLTSGEMFSGTTVLKVLVPKAKAQKKKK